MIHEITANHAMLITNASWVYVVGVQEEARSFQPSAGKNKIFGTYNSFLAIKRRKLDRLKLRAFLIGSQRGRICVQKSLYICGSLHLRSHSGPETEWPPPDPFANRVRGGPCAGRFR